MLINDFFTYVEYFYQKFDMSPILSYSKLNFGKSYAVALQRRRPRLSSASSQPYLRTNFRSDIESPGPQVDIGVDRRAVAVPERSWISKVCVRWFSHDNSLRWATQIVSFYLVLLNLVAEACPAPLFSYACEDVNNYYASVENLGGEALKKKLNRIIAPHHSLSYKEVWDALKILDAADVDKPEASPAIVEVYSLRVVSKRLAGKPEGWNSESVITFAAIPNSDIVSSNKFSPAVFSGEHLWPRSYGLKGQSVTDVHNIHPADVNVNSSRGNKFYGQCNVDSNKCLRPANKEAALDTETDNKRWAPPVKVRGDIARALMYMAVCYGFHQPGGGPDLHLSDSPSIGKREMGLLSTLLKWNEVDPPSRQEKLRNERICKFYQHNRNPFVDHPEFANRIWKRLVSSHQSSDVGS